MTRRVVQRTRAPLAPPMRDASIFGGSSPRSAGDAAEAQHAPIVLAEVRRRVATKNGLMKTSLPNSKRRKKRNKNK